MKSTSTTQEIPGPTAPKAGSLEDLREILGQDEYLRRRLSPKWKDLDCLGLQDLLETVLLLCRNLQGRLLDYGCGGSPYARVLPQFFPYVRADIAPGDGIDLVLHPNGSLPDEPAGSYDAVLSTQVLEHVPDPDRYLAEAWRLLRPGGALVLSTHGFFPEHGCPHDYYRWTGYGLERAVREAGFVVEESYKLTTGLRASIYLLNVCILFQFHWPSRGVLDFFLRSIRALYRCFGMTLMNGLGQAAAFQSRVSSRSEEDNLYLGVALRARKPEPPFSSTQAFLIRTTRNPAN